MAIVQIESGTCTGRSFATGYMAKFTSFCKRPVVDGTPQTFTAATGTDYLTATTHGYVDGDSVMLTTTTTLPSPFTVSTEYFVIYIDANNFQLASSYILAMAGTQLDITDTGTGTHSVYALGGGANWYIYDDQSTASDPYIVITDTASPSQNDYNTAPNGGAPKFLKVGYTSALAAFVKVDAYMWWDNTTQIGYGQFGGRRLATLDAALFGYSFRGGDEFMIIQTRDGTAWDIALIDDWVGDTNFLEDETTVGTTTAGVTAGSSVVLQLGSGEAANFTLNNYYYIYDFTAHDWINYVQVTNVNTGADQITVDTLTENFPTGSVIGAYMHRYYTAGNVLSSSFNESEESSSIPYCSSQTVTFSSYSSGRMYGACGLGYTSGPILASDPNDLGNYAVQQPQVYEFYNYGGSNSVIDMSEVYGLYKNILVTSKGTMAQMIDGRTYLGELWVYAEQAGTLMTGGSSTAAILIRNTETTS